MIYALNIGHDETPGLWVSQKAVKEGTLKPVSSITKEALIRNARDLREKGDASHVLHPSIKVSELTFRYREVLSELRRKFNGASQQPGLKG